MKPREPGDSRAKGCPTPFTIYSLSPAAAASGDSRAAFEAYARAFREDPEDETAQQALESISSIDDRWVVVAAHVSLLDEA